MSRSKGVYRPTSSSSIILLRAYSSPGTQFHFQRFIENVRSHSLENTVFLNFDRKVIHYWPLLKYLEEKEYAVASKWNLVDFANRYPIINFSDASFCIFSTQRKRQGCEQFDRRVLDTCELFRTHIIFAEPEKIQECCLLCDWEDHGPIAFLFRPTSILDTSGIELLDNSIGEIEHHVEPETDAWCGFPAFGSSKQLKQHHKMDSATPINGDFSLLMGMNAFPCEISDGLYDGFAFSYDDELEHKQLIERIKRKKNVKSSKKSKSRRARCDDDAYHGDNEFDSYDNDDSDVELYEEDQISNETKAVSRIRDNIIYERKYTTTDLTSVFYHKQKESRKGIALLENKMKIVKAFYDEIYYPMLELSITEADATAWLTHCADSSSGRSLVMDRFGDENSMPTTSIASTSADPTIVFLYTDFLTKCGFQDLYAATNSPRGSPTKTASGRFNFKDSNGNSQGGCSMM